MQVWQLNPSPQFVEANKMVLAMKQNHIEQLLEMVCHPWFPRSSVGIHTLACVMGAVCVPTREHGNEEMVSKVRSI